MNPNSLQIALLVTTIGVLAGCDPNPNGPSAPSVPGATSAPTRPHSKATPKGSVPLRLPD